ncbi:hypothetical protein [Anaeromyxobacter paludicola]|uniref:Uncharacterized protein n=1 Tax=Anaeromyxobacter paludicola TaxID=2918171 RepID=A0ABN6N9B8_9BACT|nr:hypothetical protein [Anaeromyxobacter paludicola]BDG08714.1 hypothetical protein AMPC_18270 [Anaeromyxobacter paludicola]
MATSRDANDPRDLMKGMRREAEREFEGSEAGDSGGVEHRGPEEQDGRPGERPPQPRVREGEEP